MQPKRKIYPSWRYHKDSGSKIVHNEKQDARLEKEGGWHDTPAHFNGEKAHPDEVVEKDEEGFESDDDGVEVADVDAGEPEDQGDLSKKSKEELKSLLLEAGFSEDELKGKNKKEFIDLLKE